MVMTSEGPRSYVTVKLVQTRASDSMTVLHSMLLPSPPTAGMRMELALERKYVAKEGGHPTRSVDVVTSETTNARAKGRGADVMRRKKTVEIGALDK